jgi:hypothetical protein
MRLARLIGGSLCAVALILAAGAIGNTDYAEALRIEAEEKEARPARARNYYRELLCDCLKQYRGRALRLQITHQPDMGMCTTTCWYDGAGPTKGTL